MLFSPDNLFLLIILALFAGACFRDLKFGIYLIIFLMPTYLWRTEIFSIPTTLLELMIYILFLIWLFKKTNHESRITNHDFKLILGIVLLFLGLTISTVFSDNLRTSLGIMKGWFVNPFLFFLVLINVVKTKKQIIHLFSAWALSGLAVAVVSLVYLITGDLTYDGRLKAFFLSPNHLAMYLAPAFLVSLVFLSQFVIPSDNRSRGICQRIKCVFQLFSPKSKRCVFYRFLHSAAASVGMTKGEKVLKYPIFNFAILIIILIPLYFTLSYGAFLGIAAAIACLIIPLLRGGWGCVKLMKKPTPSPSREGNYTPLTSFGKRIVSKKLAILCLLILSSLLFLSADKIQQVTDSNNRSSFHSRLMIWDASGEILKDNFIFGIGPGTFQDAYLNYADKFDKLYLEWAVPQPHNIFLAFWLQTGVMGLLGFILILIWFFCPGIKYKNNIQYPISNILIILMIYFLVHGLIDTTYWKNDLSLMFWILIGTMVVCRKVQPH